MIGSALVVDPHDGVAGGSCRWFWLPSNKREDWTKYLAPEKIQNQNSSIASTKCIWLLHHHKVKTLKVGNHLYLCWQKMAPGEHVSAQRSGWYTERRLGFREEGVPGQDGPQREGCSERR